MFPLKGNCFFHPVLGLDFLRDNSAHIDFETNTLHAKSNANVNVVCALDTNAGLARNDSEIVFRSRSETTVPVQISRCRYGQVVLLDPLPSLTLSQQVIAAKCLVQVTKRKAYLKVFNPTRSDVCLKTHQVLAKVEEIDSDTVIPLMMNKHQKYFLSLIRTTESKLDFNMSESDLSKRQI